MENEVIAAEPNAAYDVLVCQQREDNAHDELQLQYSRHNMPTSESKVSVKRKSISTIAGCALFLAILALLVAVVAIYFGARGTELANYSSQDYVQNISTIQEMVRILQARLDKQDATITSILTRTIWRSCSDLPPGSPSGDYWIQANGTSSPAQVYCDMNRASCSCNTTGGWMRVANLDMTDPNQDCPTGFQQVNTSAPLRTCGRPGPAGCVSTIFQIYGVEYTHVCGRVTAYQFGTPDAFGLSKAPSRGTAIDSFYVDGVSLTHGQSPLQHIWTFVGTQDEGAKERQRACPCTRSDIPYTGTIPTFVGQDYFCDTGSRETIPGRVFVFFADDPLWDGQGCGVISACCEFNNPPWFCKQLPQPTTDDLELRICADQETEDEDILIERVEIYIR